MMASWADRIDFRISKKKLLSDAYTGTAVAARERFCAERTGVADTTAAWKNSVKRDKDIATCALMSGT
jgi:hypothetical protein